MNTQPELLDRPTKPSTRALVTQIKNANEDYEWYPTTDEMLAVIKKDIGDDEYMSILDIGAGDGRALMQLTKGDRYAIEKSQPLLQAMDRSIYIVGTEFEQQTLIDKKVQSIFSSPPYTEYVAWVCKILREGNCRLVYLIIPERWKDNAVIAEVLEMRKATTDVLGSFDFLSADRAARAKVDIVRVNLGYEERYHHNSGARVDPFELWFDREFELDINNESLSKYQWDKKAKQAREETIKNELVGGQDIVAVLEKLYQRELNELMNNYKALEKLNPAILKELDVNINGLKKAIKLKVEGLKDRYWNELFNNLDKITSRLTVGARDRMLDKLTRHTHVDFTVSNSHAVLIWVIKNSNQYFDDQLVGLVERMTEQASVSLYKSNKRVYSDGDWRYCRTPDSLERYALEYRIVLHRVGGLCRSSWEHERIQHNGLEQRSFDLISDIITVANNLGFDTTKTASVRDFYYESNKAVEYHYYDPIKQEHNVLMVIRAFKNGNLHLKMNQAFIRRLNVEFGRLRGWLKSAAEAADELAIDIEEAEHSFGKNVQIGGSDLLALCFDKNAPAVEDCHP